jgi:hypothetical protein
MTLCVKFANDGYAKATSEISSPVKEKKIRDAWQLRTGYKIGWCCNGINLAYLLAHTKIFDAVTPVALLENPGILGQVNVSYVLTHLRVLSTVDVMTFKLVGICLLFILPYHRKDLKSPMARVCYAFLCKHVPQDFLAYMIAVLHVRPGGFVPVIASGWALIILRVIIGWRSYHTQKEEGTRGALLSEMWNGISWLFVTVAYFCF